MNLNTVSRGNGGKAKFDLPLKEGECYTPLPDACCQKRWEFRVGEATWKGERPSDINRPQGTHFRRQYSRGEKEEAGLLK